jgi:hypothetical protein
VIPPLAGALIKNEKDVHLLERLAFMARREGREPPNMRQGVARLNRATSHLDYRPPARSGHRSRFVQDGAAPAGAYRRTDKL